MGRQEANCIHHWVLTEPDARAIVGTCRRCGARHTYPSGLELDELAALRGDEPDAEAPDLARELASARADARV